MNELSIEQVRELAGKATPGPWRHYYIQKYGEWRVTTPQTGTCMRKMLVSSDYMQTANPGPDTALIAAAPDLARLVLAQAEELTQLKGELANSIELGNGLAARVREYERLWETEVDNAIEDNRRYKAELAELRAHRKPA